MKNFLIITCLALLIFCCSKSEYEQASEIYNRTTFQKNLTSDSSNLNDAILKLKAVLQKEPENLDAQILLWKCYIKTDDPEQQQLHDQLLHENPKVLPVLLDHLDDRDEVVRQQIVTLIGEFKDPESVPVQDL